MKKNQPKLISLDEVKHLALLARLTLSTAELKKYQRQLLAILNFFSQLNQIDTSNINPTSQVTGLENVFAQDRIVSSLTSEEALSSAQSKDNKYFKIKRILTK